MLWLKAFHIIFVVTWFAGLFYLPRLFVYHASVIPEAGDSGGLKRFEVMELRLFSIMTLGAALAVFFGLMMLANAPGYLAFGWLRWKLGLVALLMGYHIQCYRLMLDFRAGANRHSPGWYRAFNEFPTVLLIAIVILATVKP